MLKNKWPIIIVVLGTLFMVISEATKPKPQDLRITLTQTDKIAYGSFLLYELLPNIFEGKEIEVSRKSFFDFFLADSLQQKNYISLNHPIQNSRSFTKYDVESMLNFVAKGNNVFISANQFLKELTDTLSVKIEDNFFETINNNNLTSIEAPDSQNVVSTATNKNYNFKYTSIYRYFSTFDTANTEILAYKTDSLNIKEQPILIKTKFGQGNFILNSTPKIFTNFNMVNNKHNFIAEALSSLPVANTVWDEYYKPYALEEIGTSPLRYILSQKALKWALYLTMLALLIYTFFSGKRLQRIIPILQAPKNVSVDFANSLAMLYYHKKDHIEIAKKRIEYFKVFVRNKYNIDVFEASPTDIEKLNNLTMLDAKQIELIFKEIITTVNRNNISETALINLNKNIDEFYENT